MHIAICGFFQQAGSDKINVKRLLVSGDGSMSIINIDWQLRSSFEIRILMPKKV